MKNLKYMKSQIKYYTEHFKRVFCHICFIIFLVEKFKTSSIYYFIMILFFFFLIFSYNHTAVFTRFIQYFSYICFQLLNSSQPLSPDRVSLFVWVLQRLGPVTPSSTQDLFCFLRPQCRGSGKQRGQMYRKPPRCCIKCY